MNTDQVVDLSVDDCNDESLRKRIDRKKMNELRKYIPFLEFISRLDPVKNYNFKQLLRWLKINTEFPARMAATCEMNIITKYNKIKNTTDLPAHIVEVFTEKDAIIISDEDDELPLPQNAAHSSKDLETIDLEDEDPKKSPTYTTTAKSAHTLGVQASETVEPVLKKGSITIKPTSSPKTANNTISEHSGDLGRSNSLHAVSNLALEEGEILSDGDDVKENMQKKEANSKVVQKIEAGFSESMLPPSEDDIINEDLFKRIDSFDDENCGKRSQSLSSKEKEEDASTSILRQKNLEGELFSRRSPKKTRTDSLSSITSAESLRVIPQKKKKKKRKRRKKKHNQTDWYVSEVENQTEKGENEIMKTKIYRKEPIRDDEKNKNTRKPKKQNKEQKQSRLLYISDDEEHEVLLMTKNDHNPKLSENSNDSSRNHILHLVDPCEPPTVVLSDSNDEEVSQISNLQEQYAERTLDREPKMVEKVPSSSAVKKTSNEEAAKSQENKENPTIQNVMQDINSMNLHELNDIYAKLCDATGIQLEELLIDLVGKSTQKTQETQQSSQVEVPRANKVTAQTIFERDSPIECLNDYCSEKNKQYEKETISPVELPKMDMCDSNIQYEGKTSNTFAFQQLQRQYQQNQTQPYQMGAYSHSQQDMQSQAQMNVQCQPLPVQLPYQHTLRPGLNLNDPRIVQRLKQIKDSPIHSINIRQSATLLMDHHVSLMPSRPLPVPEITSRTATTYGEHKRLRELERKRELERQANKTSTMIANQTSKLEHTGVREEVSTAKRVSPEKNDKSANQDSSKSLSERSEVEDSNRKNNASTDKTIMSFTAHKPLRKSPSPLEDNTLSLENSIKSKDNIISGRITPFVVDKVVSIVLAAIGPVNADNSKRLKRLSSQLESRRNSCQDDDGRQSPDLEKVPTRNEDNTAINVVEAQGKSKDSTTESRPPLNSARGRGRPRSKKSGAEKSVLKKSPTKLHGMRELNNLNCTFLEYQEIFRRNTLETNGGKRRCINSSNAIRDQSSSDEAKRYSDDNAPNKKIAAAPIKRRRQTCSALNDNSKEKNDSPAQLKFVFRRLSGSGTFGIDNVQKTKSTVESQKQQKPMQKVQEVKVMVRKLSFDEIRMKTNRPDSNNQIAKVSEVSEGNKPAEEPILVPISSVDCLSQTKAHQRLSRYVNDDINMTLNSTKTCVICSKRSLDLTSHYVLLHKTESFISRLSTEEIEVLENEIKLATLSRKRYKTTCVFCQDVLEVNHFVQFHAHFSYHTGEYGFKCSVCEVVKPYREDIKSHQHRTSRCRNGKIRTNYLYQSDLKVIYLYICKLCNFVQLNEANIHKHQRDHHSFRFEAPQHVKKFIICALDDAKVINESLPPNEIDSIGGGMEYVESNEDSLQDFLQEYPLDIKDVLISLENDNNLENSSDAVSSKGDAEKEKVSSTSTPNSVPQIRDTKLSDNQMPVISRQCINTSQKGAIKESAVEKSTNVNCQTAIDETKSYSTCPSPETLVEQLHGCGKANNVMTVVHVEKQASCVEYHKPYEEVPDVKPTLSEIKIEKPDEEVSASSPSLIKKISYRKVTSGINYFGLYKCMISECWFSTNEAEKYIRHVQAHATNGQQQVLSCAYCSSKHTCAKLLVKHIRTRHSMSCYQCSACTYRSVVSANVSFHLEMYHEDITEEKCIFKCVGRVRTREDKLAALKEKMKENVNKIACRDCSAQYYSLSLMKSHIESTYHSVDVNGLLKYACMFCEVESNSLEEMRIHLVTIHPNDACWIVERELNNPADGDSIENLKWVNMALPGPNEIKIRVAEFKEEEPELVGTMNQTELDILERIKPLLELITEKTGVYRSELYKCTVCNGSFFTYELWLNHVESRHGINDKVKCPYCPQEITLEKVVQHFENHLRHEYICLHCVKTFGSKLELEEHFEAKHRNFAKTIGRHIVYSNARKYYIMKGEVGPSAWIPTLRSFAEVLRKCCIEKLYENRCSEWCFELGQFCFEDIDIPQFEVGSGKIFNCLVNSCAFESLDENEFMLHLNQHTVPHSYDCPHCGKIMQTSWDGIKDHHMLHRSNAFHICCVCKFIHYSRSAVSEHIKEFHNSRDVPIITLCRDISRCSVSASIVIPANKMAFVTTTTCFCCGQGMTNSKGVMSHLIDIHGIAVCRKCELCGSILLNRKEAEEHREEHGSADFTIRYDILTSSLSNLAIDSISPFRINLKRITEKRLPEADIEIPSKREKLDAISLNIKQEVNKGEDINMNYDSSSEKPSCSIKCVNINQLVTTTTISTPIEPMPGLTNINSIKDILLERSPLCPSNTLNYRLEESNNMTINQSVPHQQTIHSSNSTQSAYTPTAQQVPVITPQSSQSITSQHYSNYNIQCFPPNEHHQAVQPQQIRAGSSKTTPISVPRYCSNKDIQSNQCQPAAFQSVIRHTVRTPVVHYRPQAVQHPPSNPAQQPSSFTAQRTSISAQHLSSIPTQHSLSSTAQRQPSFATQLGLATTATIQSQALVVPDSQSNIMSITLPNNQGVVTVASGLPLPSSSSGEVRLLRQLPSIQQSQNNASITLPNNQGIGAISTNVRPVYGNSSYNINPHSSHQSADAIVSLGAFQTNSLENSNLTVQTIEEIANTIDLNWPELLPICGNCRLECTSFVMLLSHFRAKHESQHRFIFRVERRVECGYCNYRGSIPSFSKHNHTFHPGQAFLCKSVFDRSRCGVCNGVFIINTMHNITTLYQCNCPTQKRILSDCIDLDALKLLQKFGKKYIGFTCDICRKVFHNEKDCLDHIGSVHQQFGILPKKWPLNDLVFLCCACGHTSPSVQDLILHIGEKHNINSSSSTLENRLSYYKKIRVIYPRGLMVTLDSLSNAGYNEECLRKDIQTVDANLRS